MYKWNLNCTKISIALGSLIILSNSLHAMDSDESGGSNRCVGSPSSSVQAMEAGTVRTSDAGPESGWAGYKEATKRLLRYEKFQTYYKHLCGCISASIVLFLFVNGLMLDRGCTSLFINCDRYEARLEARQAQYQATESTTY